MAVETSRQMAKFNMEIPDYAFFMKSFAFLSFSIQLGTNLKGCPQLCVFSIPLGTSKVPQSAFLSKSKTS